LAWIAITTPDRESLLAIAKAESIQSIAAAVRLTTALSSRDVRPSNRAVALDEPTRCTVAKTKPPRRQRTFSTNSFQAGFALWDSTAIPGPAMLREGFAKYVSRMR
jgi:hypothetical protein